MNKLKASLIHLTLSVIAISILFSIVYCIWYPKPFFEISGVIEPLKLLILIDVIVGPLLTFIVYKKGKPTLVMDLSIIAILQISALLYGAYTIYNGRPTLIVMNQGKFNYLIQKYSDYSELESDLRPHVFSKPKYAYNLNRATLDLYQDSKNTRKVENNTLDFSPFSFSKNDMLNRFSKLEPQLNEIEMNYKDYEIEYYLLDHDGAEYYVVYSKQQQKIIDRLDFN